MDWTALLRLPTTILWLLATGMLLLTLVQLVALRERMQTQSRLLVAGGFALLLVTIVLTVLLAVAGASLRGYHLLNEDTPVVEVEARILSPQRWALTLHGSDGSTRRLQLSGDAWRMEAVMVARQESGLLARLPSLYKLDRVSGRYDDAAQESQAAPTAVNLQEAGTFDLLGLHQYYPDWLPAVNALNGDGSFLPLIDEGRYSIRLSRNGTLATQPDETTARRLAQPLGD
ncbi:hypothetical protein [Dyella silvatica]|uniref:hypothetical protein n=1 Tax=Dyella silvatica TaxID=2992128 RepID=UPI00224D0A85|nr:hypothetical protein [Dyella silvatica]